MITLLGSIVLLPYDFEPSGWKFCDGSELPISGYEQLFTLLGSTFGGDGEWTFKLPNLEAAAPDECHYCISLYGFSEREGYEGLLGETMLWASPADPRNLVECTGQTLPTAQYRLLQTFVGTRFGGDANNFKLPDLRSKAPANCRYMMAVNGSYPVGNSPRTPFVGQIVLLPYEVDVSQSPWRLCNGDLLQAKDHQALARLLGDKFGGDRREKVGLPDLRAAAPPKFNYYISLQGEFPARS